jgi:hypothetical protein
MENHFWNAQEKQLIGQSIVLVSTWEGNLNLLLEDISENKRKEGGTF